MAYVKEDVATVKERDPSVRGSLEAIMHPGPNRSNTLSLCAPREHSQTPTVTSKSGISARCAANRQEGKRRQSKYFSGRASARDNIRAAL